MIGLALVAGSTFRRMLGLRALILAAGLGLVTGLLVLALPAPDLARDVYELLLLLFGAVLVLPLMAGLPTSDRAGGYEALCALRPISSGAWAVGRLVGQISGGSVLVVLLAICAREVGGARQVPQRVAGELGATLPNGDRTWRFPLLMDEGGTFDLELELLFLEGLAGDVTVTARRGASERAVSRRVVPQRRLVVPLPVPSDEAGDLYVTIGTTAELRTGREAPRLVVGTRALGRGGLPLPRDALGSLLLAALAVLAGSSAFRFETACLSGLLVLALPQPSSPLWFWAVGLGLLLVATLGIAISRRQALP